MATQKRLTPARPWEIDDLNALGKKGGVTYLKAIPVLILEEWFKQGQKTEVYVRTKVLEKRLVDSGLHPVFPKKGTSNILAALSSIQKDRNATNPPLMKTKARGAYWVNVGDYIDILDEFHQNYRKDHREDYKKLFPNGAPPWEFPILPKETKEVQETHSELKVKDEIKGILDPVEQTLRDQQQAIKNLTEKNQKLQAELIVLQKSSQDEHKDSRHVLVDDELRNECAKFMENRETYIDAIRRAGVVLEERLRKTIGGDGPEKFKNGVDLVEIAFAKSSGKLIISDHPAEQEGVFMLFRGAVQFVRNPPAHKKMQYAELEAWQTIGLIDYLLLLLKHVKPKHG
jgi:hypothetical protein